MGWVVNATTRPLYPRERPGTHCIGGWVGPRASLDSCGESEVGCSDIIIIIISSSSSSSSSSSITREQNLLLWRRPGSVRSSFR